MKINFIKNLTSYSLNFKRIFKPTLFMCLSLLFTREAFSQTKLSICANKAKNQIYAATSCPRNTTKLSYDNIVGGKIPSGATVYGLIGGRYETFRGAGSFDSVASLPGKTAQIFNAESQIQVANTPAVDNDCGGSTCLMAEEKDVAAVCTGSPENPTAPAGIVCIYPSMRLNAKAIVGYNLVNGFNGNTPSPQNFGAGFGLGWEANGDIGDSLVEAVWAYTAP